jgi:CRP-like cAMP-binding protein
MIQNGTCIKLKKRNILIEAGSKEPSKFYVETLEDTSFFSMEYEMLEEMVSNNPKLEKNRKFLFRRVIRQAKDRMESFVSLSPEKRYLKFIKDYPGLTNRVQDKYIAHVLGCSFVA